MNNKWLSNFQVQNRGPKTSPRRGQTPVSHQAWPLVARQSSKANPDLRAVSFSHVSVKSMLNLHMGALLADWGRQRRVDFFLRPYPKHFVAFWNHNRSICMQFKVPTSMHNVSLHRVHAFLDGDVQMFFIVFLGGVIYENIIGKGFASIRATIFLPCGPVLLTCVSNPGLLRFPFRGAYARMWFVLICFRSHLLSLYFMSSFSFGSG